MSNEMKEDTRESLENALDTEKQNYLAGAMAGLQYEGARQEMDYSPKTSTCIVPNPMKEGVITMFIEQHMPHELNSDVGHAQRINIDTTSKPFITAMRELGWIDPPAQ